MLTGMENPVLKTLVGTCTDDRRHFDDFGASAKDNRDHTQQPGTCVPAGYEEAFALSENMLI